MEAEVRVDRRLRADGRSTPGWNAKKTYIVPAFAIPLAELARLARAMSTAAGSVGEVPHEPVRGGILLLDDAVTFIRHMVVGDEVRQADMLASVEVSVTLVEHRLAATPYSVHEGGLQCAVTGVSIHAGEAPR